MGGRVGGRKGCDGAAAADDVASSALLLIQLVTCVASLVNLWLLIRVITGFKKQFNSSNVDFKKRKQAESYFNLIFVLQMPPLGPGCLSLVGSSRSDEVTTS